MCEDMSIKYRELIKKEKEENPLQALKLRLAKGEITLQEYEKLEKILN